MQLAANEGPIALRHCLSTILDSSSLRVDSTSLR